MYTYIRYKGMFHSNIPLTAPLKVTGLSVTESGSGGNLNVSWSTPQSELTITGYEVEYRTRDAEQWRSHSVLPPSTSTLLTGLNAGAGYIVRVRAVSVIGAGAWSDEKIMRPDDGEFYGVCTVRSAFVTLDTLSVIVKELSHPVPINLLCYGCSLLFAKHCMANC